MSYILGHRDRWDSRYFFDSWHAWASLRIHKRSFGSRYDPSVLDFLKKGNISVRSDKDTNPLAFRRSLISETSLNSLSTNTKSLDGLRERQFDLPIGHVA